MPDLLLEFGRSTAGRLARGAPPVYPAPRGARRPAAAFHPDRTSGVMTPVILRSIETAEKSELAALQSEAFDDYEPSSLLAEVLASEAAVRPQDDLPALPSLFGVAAYKADTLVGWSQGYRQGRREFHMLNSGVRNTGRRQGIYTTMVRAMLAHAEAQGYQRVTSRHSASNNAVIMAKLRLGFRVSGFEYSEVYGPLVQLTYLVNAARERLYRIRAASIRTPPG